MSSPLGTLFAPAVGVADTGFEQSRVMQTKAHIDGMRMVGAGELVSNSSNLVLTRSGNGRWNLGRTAAGAETYFVRTTLSRLLRIGENFQYGDFGGSGFGYAADKPPKGVGVIDMFVALSIGVVNLTSATLRLGKTVYGAGAPVQTDIVAATALGSVATVANPVIQTVAVPTGTQIFSTDDLGLVEVELSVVMANTGTVAIEGIGAHLAFNFN